MLETCHIRVVDGHPAHARYTCVGTHMLNVMQEKDFEISPEVKECASSPFKNEVSAHFTL